MIVLIPKKILKNHIIERKFDTTYAWKLMFKTIFFLIAIFHLYSHGFNFILSNRFSVNISLSSIEKIIIFNLAYTLFRLWCFFWSMGFLIWLLKQQATHRPPNKNQINCEFSLNALIVPEMESCSHTESEFG